MKVQCISDYQYWKKGEIYCLHHASENRYGMRYYLDCPNDHGYESGKWGFHDLDDLSLTTYFEVINDKHDSHYKACAIEPWEIMEKNFTHDEFVGFLKGNIQKYLSRIGRKGQDLDDCDKIINYAQKLKEVLGGVKHS